jgi:2,4-dihydroxyhept-2-ene-1,7-dioic acid aldolase
MRFNKMKSKLANGEPALGVTLQEVSLQSAEILGLLGFDYINIDCLHSSLNVESVVPMVLAAELRGITTLVRFPENRAEVILPYLDAGVHGNYCCRDG